MSHAHPEDGFAHTTAMPLPPDMRGLPDQTVVLLTVRNGEGDEGYLGCIVITLKDATAFDPETGEVLPQHSGDAVRVMVPLSPNVFDEWGVYTGTFGDV